MTKALVPLSGRLYVAALVALFCQLGIGISGLSLASAQGHDDQAYASRGSDNIEIISHLPLGARGSVADIEIEQELDRPFAYVARMHYLEEGQKGLDIISLANPGEPEVIHRWRIEDQELHQRRGGMDIKYFKWEDRYYVVLATQFFPGGPDHDLAAVVLDVTGLPDPSSVREVARIREPDTPGGFHNIFAYKHSNGRAFLFGTVSGSGPHANVYDLGMLVEEGPENAMVSTVPVPDTPIGPGLDVVDVKRYHDFYVAYHWDTDTDRFYGGGTGGYFVFDITDIQRPELLATLTGINGVPWGHTFTPGPEGRYAVTEAEYQYAPLRIFDLKPALDGDVEAISSPISAWTANWRHLSHNHEVRWPLVFVSAYVDGLQVFSLKDPENPRTFAWYDTYPGSVKQESDEPVDGAFGVDVRNADGLIVVSDMETGFWAFRMKGFDGWTGHQWGVPDISSAQKWDEGPRGSQ